MPGRYEKRVLILDTSVPILDVATQMGISLHSQTIEFVSVTIIEYLLSKTFMRNELRQLIHDGLCSRNNFTLLPFTDDIINAYDLFLVNHVALDYPDHTIIYQLEGTIICIEDYGSYYKEVYLQAKEDLELYKRKYNKLYKETTQ